jgi:hypothetical protein
VVIADMSEVPGSAQSDDLGDVTTSVCTDVTNDASIDTAIAAAAELGPLRVTVIARRGRTADNEPVASQNMWLPGLNSLSPQAISGRAPGGGTSLPNGCIDSDTNRYGTSGRAS